MSNKLFSDTEVYEFSLNPNVESVSNKSIRFSKNFKQALSQALANGIKAEEFLRANGIDPEILGKSRIIGLVQKLDNPDLPINQPPFENRNTLHTVLPDKSNLSDKKRIHELELKTAYLEQEVEFLKKIVQANLEVQKNLVYEPDPV